MLFAVLATLVSLAHSAPSQCTTLASQNITQPDMAAPRFMVTAADCCNACGATNGCLAAVYASYYCHLKSSLDGMIPTAGSQVLIAVPVPPPQPPLNTTTSVPTTTAAPGTTAVPTPQPTEAPWEIVREIYCQYSSHCNMSNDMTCTSGAYFNNTCSGKHKRICGTYTITVDQYEGEGCSGVVKAQTTEDINTCEYITENGNYGHYCDVQKAPTAGIDVYHSTCLRGCDEMPDCSVSNLKSGVCQSNPFGWLTGSSVIAWCFPQYILWLGYGSIDCSGPVQQGITQPYGCYETGGYDWNHNICGSNGEFGGY